MPRRNLALATAAMLSILTPMTAWGQAKPKSAQERLADVEAKIEATEKKAADAETKAADAETKADDAETRAADAETKAEDAETKAEDAETKAADAETKAETLSTKVETAQGTVDSLRTGKLISSGLTGGVALAVQFVGPFNRAQAEQTAPGVVAMPYLLALPAYWGTPQATREACASSWSGGDEHTSYSAAQAVATKRAERIFASIEKLVTVRPTASPEVVAAELSLDYGDGQRDTNERIVKWVQSYVTAKNGATSPEEKAKAEQQKLDTIAAMAGIEWNASRTARCWTKRFGVWVGVPLNYDAMTRVPHASGPAEDDAVRTIKPVFAFGLAFSPNAYFSLLAGLSVGNVQRDAKDDVPELNRTIWSSTIAIGGNLDIATALVK